MSWLLSLLPLMDKKEIEKSNKCMLLITFAKKKNG